MFKDNEVDYQKINVFRMLRSVRGAIKKAIFYLGAKIPYDYTEDLVGLSAAKLEEYLSHKGEKIKKYVELDSKIRMCDDILDNQLSRITPRPIEKMREVITQFVKEVPEAKTVAELFRAEIDISNHDYNPEQTKEKIKNLIEIRPCDFFLLVQNITKDFKTALDKNDYRYSLEFFIEFQRLRDLLDDIMSTEEDLLKNDYNSIVIARQKKISYHFFEEIIMEKLDNLVTLCHKIKNHPNKEVLEDSITFWKNQYDILFKRLLIDYYIDVEEFRKSYFMIKQL